MKETVTYVPLSTVSDIIASQREKIANLTLLSFNGLARDDLSVHLCTIF